MYVAQPCEPCRKGTAPSMPRNTRHAPSGAHSLQAFRVDTYVGRRARFRNDVQARVHTAAALATAFTSAIVFALILPLPSAGVAELPDRARHGGMHLAREIDHALKARQGFFALVVVIAEPHAELVGDGPLLHAADEQIDLLLLEKSRQFQRIGIIHDDRARIAQFASCS